MKSRPVQKIISASLALCAYCAVAATSGDAEPSATTEAAITSTTAPAASSDTAQIPLWRGLNYGMTPDEAAAALRVIPEIKAVSIVRKKKKPTRLTIVYTDPMGIDLGPVKAVITPLFNDQDKLLEITLAVDECKTIAIDNDKLLASTLREKFPANAREKVVFPMDGSFDYQLAFWDAVTRVRMSFASNNPALAEGSVPGSGVAGQIGDIFGAISSNAARYACRVDEGERLRTNINYSSQRAFQLQQARDKEDAERVRSKMREGL